MRDACGEQTPRTPVSLLPQKAPHSADPRTGYLTPSLMDGDLRVFGEAAIGGGREVVRQVGIEPTT